MQKSVSKSQDPGSAHGNGKMEMSSSETSPEPGSIHPLKESCGKCTEAVKFFPDHTIFKRYNHLPDTPRKRTFIFFYIYDMIFETFQGFPGDEPRLKRS